MLAKRSVTVNVLNPSQLRKGLVLSLQYGWLAGRGQMPPAMEKGRRESNQVVTLAGEKSWGQNWNRAYEVLGSFTCCTTAKSFQKDYLLFNCKISRERFLKIVSMPYNPAKLSLLPRSWPQILFLKCKLTLFHPTREPMCFLTFSDDEQPQRPPEWPHPAFPFLGQRISIALAQPQPLHPFGVLWTFSRPCPLVIVTTKMYLLNIHCVLAALLTVEGREERIYKNTHGFVGFY